MSYIENKAELCPVCNGTGIYKKVIEADKNTSIGLCSYEHTCHGCGGKGWIIVPTYNTTVTGG